MADKPSALKTELVERVKEGTLPFADADTRIGFLQKHNGVVERREEYAEAAAMLCGDAELYRKIVKENYDRDHDHYFNMKTSYRMSKADLPRIPTEREFQERAWHGLYCFLAEHVALDKEACLSVLDSVSAMLEEKIPETLIRRMNGEKIGPYYEKND